MKSVGKFLVLILGLITAGVTFFGPQKVRAADTDVVFNEVMANAPTPETDLEWIELYNNSLEPIDLNGWKLDEKTITDPSAIIQGEDFLILARNATEFKNYWGEVTVSVVQISMGLTNGSDQVVLESADGLYQEEFAWESDPGNNISWERIDSRISADDNWRPTLIEGGTP